MSNSGGAEPMEVEKGSAPVKKILSKQDLTELIHKYFAQLTQGCGRPNCPDLYCASNSGFLKMDNNSAAALAVQLTYGGPEHLCPPYVPTTRKPLVFPPPSTPPPFLDLPTLKTMIEGAKRDNNFMPLAKKIAEVFGSPESMEVSFLHEGPDTNYEVFLKLDVAAVKEAYKLLLELNNEAVSNFLVSATGRLCAHLKRIAHSTTNSEGTLRMIVMMYENPQLQDPETYKDILGPLLVNITLLPPSSSEILREWFAHFTADEYRRHLSLIQQFITLHILMFNPVSLNREPFIVAATKVLALLHPINERRGLIPYIEFYNELINDKIDLKEDYTNWKHSSGFTFCSYPFVLHPLVKSKILQIESYLAMRAQRDEAVLMMGMAGVPVLLFRVRRDHLIRDTLTEISRHPRKELHKELKVQFVGEAGIDQGGVQKEFFQLIIREIFDAKYGMFVHNKIQTYWFNGISHDFHEFRLIGTILGLAIYNSVILDVHFPQVVYKKLMGVVPNMNDLQDVNLELLQGMKKVLTFDGDVESTFGLTFQITYESFGEMLTHDLKPNGGSIPVTTENRQEYVDLYVEYLLTSSVKDQFGAFVEGFRTVCNSVAFELFRWEELELLICGSPILDFEQLQSVTVYDNGYNEDHPVIKNFWEVVHSLPLEEKKMLLFFTTGSDRSPIGGLANLQLAITRQPDSDRLPSAHTCFNHLILPEYPSKEKLRERLLAAIHNAEGFGLM